MKIVILGSLLFAAASFAQLAVSWTQRLQDARQLLDRDSFGEAIKAFRETLALAAAAHEAPVTLAGIRCELGFALSEAGEPSAAVEMVGSLIAIRSTRDKIPIAICAHRLALHYRTAGRYEESRLLLDEAIAIEEKSPGRESALARVLVSSAGLETLKGSASKADEHARRALHVIGQNPNATDAERASTYAMLTLTSRALQRPADVLLYAERELNLRNKTGASKPADLLRVLCLLAATNVELRRFSKADQWAKQIEAVLAAHPNLESTVGVNARVTLAYTASQRGDLRGAERSFEQALALTRDQSGAKVLDMVSIWTHLGRVRRRLGNFAGAEQCHQAALSMLKDAVPDSHPFVAFALLDLADTYRLMRRYSDAIGYYRRGFAMTEEFEGPDSARLAPDYELFATVLRKTNNKAESRKYLALSKKAKANGVGSSAMSFTVDGSGLRPRNR